MIVRPSFLPLVVLNQRPAGSGLPLAVALIGGLMIWACGGGETTGPAGRQLGFGVQPTDAIAGEPFAPAMQVQVRDANGNVVSTASDVVTLALGSASDVVTLALGANPGGATLSGTLMVTAVNGIASFSDLAIDKGGSGYTLTATAGSLASISLVCSPGRGAERRRVAGVSPKTHGKPGVRILPRTGWSTS